MLPNDFQKSAGILANLASTPGWEDGAGHKTEQGAKPIGMAQWGSAIMTAKVVTDAVPGAPWPTPGIDPAGFIWLTWKIADNAQLALECHANLLSNEYRWQSIQSGQPVQHKSLEIRSVIEALRAVIVSAKRT